MWECEKAMYLGANPATIRAARILRESMIHEKMLWEKLKGKQIYGLRFRRQHPLSFFIADFYCHEARLVVEVDGTIHKYRKNYDESRSGELERFSIEVIRFKNSELENDIDKVVECIKNNVKRRTESPPWGI